MVRKNLTEKCYFFASNGWRLNIILGECFFILYSSLPFRDSGKQTSNISGLALNMAGPEGRHDQKNHPVENSLDG